MPLEIIRTLDQVKLLEDEIKALIEDYIAQKTGRIVKDIYLSMTTDSSGRGEKKIGAAIVTLVFQDGE